MPSTFSSIRGAERLFLYSTVARLPLATLGIGLLAHAAGITGSYTAAGIVAGAYAIALGIGGPVAARQVDRRGQTVVLCATSVVAAVLLLAIGTLGQGTPLGVLVALAALIGLATPPVGACMRAVLPSVLPDAGSARSAFAVEAAVAELTWVAGPPFTLGLAALTSPGLALAVSGVVLVVPTLAFAALPASRAWTPAVVREARGALASRGLRTLVLVLGLVGVLFGALEVAVAATVAGPHEAANAAPFLALWGLGSFAGGVWAARRGGAPSATALAGTLGALALGHLLLMTATGTDLQFGAMLLVAGVAIAPTLAIAFAMVDELAPQGTVTEAFAWLATAESVGAAFGSSLAGGLADHSGPVPALALAGAAGAAAMVATLLGRRSLRARPGVVLAAKACAATAV